MSMASQVFRVLLGPPIRPGWSLTNIHVTNHSSSCSSILAPNSADVSISGSNCGSSGLCRPIEHLPLERTPEVTDVGLMVCNRLADCYQTVSLRATRLLPLVSHETGLPE